MKKVCSEVLETTRLISLIFPRNIFPTYYKNDKYKVNSTKKKKKVKAQELKHLVTSTKQIKSYGKVIANFLKLLLTVSYNSPMLKKELLNWELLGVSIYNDMVTNWRAVYLSWNVMWPIIVLKKYTWSFFSSTISS